MRSAVAPTTGATTALSKPILSPCLVGLPPESAVLALHLARLADTWLAELLAHFRGGLAG